MLQVCGFNDVRDVRPVDQFGYVDLESAYKNGVVPASVENEDIKYNNQTDPTEIGRVPRDKFDAYEYTRSVRDSVGKAEASDKDDNA